MRCLGSDSNEIIRPQIGGRARKLAAGPTYIMLVHPTALLETKGHALEVMGQQGTPILLETQALCSSAPTA